MVQTESTKYEKRMLKIWEKWNPDGSSETSLEHFIKDSHPAIRDMRGRVSGYVQAILRGIESSKGKKREKMIEEIVKSSWDMVNNYGEEFVRKYCDEKVLYIFFGIYFGGSNSIWIERDEEEEIMTSYSGKSRFFMDEKDLDKDWDLIWEWNQYDQHWGSDELKDWIWNEEYFGLKQDLMPLLEQAQAIIPDELKKEIEDKLKKMNDVLLPIKSEWEQLEIDRADGGKYEDIGWCDLKEKGLFPEPVNKKLFADEFWKDLDHMGIVKRLEEEEEALKASRRYKKDLGKVILEVSEYGGVALNFKDDNACQINGWKTLKGMKDGWFVGGGTEMDYGWKSEGGEIWFTPEWGESKGINDIEDFIKHIGKQRKIKEGYFWCRWLKEESDNFPIKERIDVENPENTKESEEKLIKEHTIESYWARHSMYEKHSYFHLKDNEVEEIVDRDLPHKGILSGGNDGDLAFAYAISNGKKEWKYEGKKWTEDSFLRDRNPEDYEDEEEEN